MPRAFLAKLAHGMGLADLRVLGPDGGCALPGSSCSFPDSMLEARLARSVVYGSGKPNHMKGMKGP
jgi:hypothetical protein